MGTGTGHTLKGRSLTVTLPVPSALKPHIHANRATQELHLSRASADLGLRATRSGPRTRGALRRAPSPPLSRGQRLRRRGCLGQAANAAPGPALESRVAFQSPPLTPAKTPAEPALQHSLDHSVRVLCPLGAPALRGHFAPRTGPRGAPRAETPARGRQGPRGLEGRGPGTDGEG